MSLMMQSSATQAQSSGELVIHNGLIVNEDGRTQADVRIIRIENNEDPNAYADALLSTSNDRLDNAL
jgi:hypothetical protein